MKFSDFINGVKGFFFLPVWWFQKFHKRRDNLWTFGAWNGERYSDNSRALFEYVLKNHPEIDVCWMTNSKDVERRLLSEGKPVALCNSKKGKRIQYDSSVFFATEGFRDGAYKYMNGIHYINLWHGMPLKQIGKDEMNFKRSNTLMKTIKTALRRIVVPWEFLSGPTLTSSRFFTPFFMSAFQLPEKDVWEYGYPRNDWFVSHDVETLIAETDKKFSYPLKVFYMPTFRDTQVGQFNPFKKAGFNPQEFNSVLEKENIVFFYKGHFCDADITDSACSNRIITVSDNDYDNLYSFLKDVDILITDYSSVYFDFLYLKKPIILFPFDEEDYVSHSRPFYFDYCRLDSIRVYSWSQLTDCLRDRNYYPPSDEEIGLFCSAKAGYSCKQIVAHFNR